MSNVIKPKRGTTDPAPGVLAEGEIGINTSAATAFVGVAGGGSKKLNASNSETADAVNSTGEATANRNRHVWFSDADDEKKRVYNDNFQYNPSTNTISANVGGTSSNVTGVVGIEHGGTGAMSRGHALTALLAGGGTETDANIVEPGTYVLNTGTGSNLPPESGYYLLTVFRYDTSDLACGQIAINLSNGNLYSRDYVTGVWKDWVCCSSRKIDTILIPNGADLNNYRDKGFYASNRASNSISNLPSDLGTGAFELVVTGIDADGLYCTQWLKSYERNIIWVRTQVSYKEPWVWSNWERIIMATTPVLTLNAIELGQFLSSTDRHGGFLDFHFNGSKEDYTSRIIEVEKGVIKNDGNFYTTGYLQSLGGVWLSGGSLFVNPAVYGTSLPAAGISGRVFFKKV